MLRPMPYNSDRTGGLFAELAVHDSRETIKRALAAAEEFLALRIDYRSEPSGAGSERRFGGDTVTVPLCFSDGRLAGELRCTRADGEPVSDRDVAFVQVLARIVASQLESEE